MVVRMVTANLRAGQAPEYARIVDQEVIPMMRKLTGFKDEIVLVSADGKETAALSFWQRREDFEAYNRTTYPNVLQALTNCIEGTPTTKEFEVTNSTAHAIAGRKAGA